MLSNTSTSEPSSPHSAFSGLESLSIHDRDTVDRAASVDPAPVDSLADLIEEAHETGDHAALIAWREAEVQKARSEAFAACLSFAIGDDRPKLALYALAFAIGAPEIQGLSLRKLASLCGVTPAAFSKRVRQIVETFGIQSRGIRSEQATRHYRLARVRRLILVRSAR
ncbi:MAG: hypothetical protein JO317_03495, partial [Verrucomicrobiae bacterium]|nr:hypothetical protein [Verrucomicrobiae bacterium]